MLRFLFTGALRQCDGRDGYKERTRLGGFAKRPRGRDEARRLRFSCLWLVVFCLIAGISCRVWGQSVPTRRVVVALVPGLRAEDLTSPLLPVLQTLRTEGAAGWMVCRAARTTTRALLRSDGRDSAASLILTLGSGSRALAVEAGKRKKEKGKSGEDGTVAAISALRILSGSVDHAVAVGALGDLVHARGWQTAVLGDAKYTEAEGCGRLLAMDGQGKVDVTPQSLRDGRDDPSAPYGRRDDVESLIQTLRRLPARVAFVVIVFGDLARADEYGSLCLPPQRDAFRADALRELNTLLFQLRGLASGDGAGASASPYAPASPPASANNAMAGARLYALSAAPAVSSDVTDRIAPLLLWGKGIAPGVLTSPSTRLPGVVVNTDFLPSIAADLGISPPRGAIGRPFAVLPANADACTTAYWRAQHGRLLLSERLKDVYGGLPTGQTLLVLAAFWAWRKGWTGWTYALAAAIVALPLGMLLLPFLPFAAASVWAAGVTLTLWTLLFMGLAAQGGGGASRAQTLLTGMFALLLAALTLDLVTGSRLLRQAWMSYSVMETARFYGIGNEYMGAAIGAACILLGVRGRGSGVRGRVYTFLSSVFCLLLVLILGYNRFGAKVGAIPSAGCALGVTLLVLWRGRLRGRDVGAILLGSLLLLSGLAWLDARHGVGEQSHLARAVGGGASGLMQIARRKLLLEGYLLWHSPWSAALVSASGVFWRLCRTGLANRQDIRAQAANKQKQHEATPSSLPNVETGRSADNIRRRAVTCGLVTGSLASLLCNDSGVTAAALIMLFGCAWRITLPHTSERMAQPNAHTPETGSDTPEAEV